MARSSILLLVERLSDELSSLIRSEDPDVFRFKKLPFIAVDEEHPAARMNLPGVRRKFKVSQEAYRLAWAINRTLLEADHLGRVWAPNGNRWACGIQDIPQHPRALGEEDQLTIDWLPLTVWSRIAHPTVLNLSLQLAPRSPLTPTDLLSVSTRVASRYMPVVVGAGNYWRRPDVNSLNLLARLPWTIGVGAMEDQAGTQLHPCSSAGVNADEKADESVGPTVVAYGENDFVPGSFGTSYAAPRVSHELCFLTAFIHQLAAAADGLLRGEVLGVPLPLQCTIDYGPLDPEQSVEIPMLPTLGINRDALEQTLKLLGPAAFDVELMPTPERMTSMLVESARTVPGYGRHEVGAGFISDKTSLAYLASFTGADLARIFSADTRHLSERERRELGRCRLGNQRDLSYLRSLVLQVRLRHYIDLNTGTIHATMRDPGLDGEPDRWWKEGRADPRWPPLLDFDSFREPTSEGWRLTGEGRDGLVPTFGSVTVG